LRTTITFEDYIYKVPLYLFPKLWNNLNLDLKLTRSKPIVFSTNLKFKFLNTYSLTYKCTRHHYFRYSIFVSQKTSALEKISIFVERIRLQVFDYFFYFTNFRSSPLLLNRLDDEM
jgi:hypothetical protein